MIASTKACRVGFAEGDPVGILIGFGTGMGLAGR
jgi:hypothetical protein